MNTSSTVFKRLGFASPKVNRTRAWVLELFVGVFAVFFPLPLITGELHGQDIYNSQEETVPKMTPSEVIASCRLPEGFRIEVAASEPDVQQPIAMAWDLRGRLWVAENYTYAESAKKFDMQLSDRILVLEDTDRDGDFDKRTVFYENLKELTSIEVGNGGIWALASPNLVFIPDADQNDVPDSEPQVLVTGFNPAIRHNFANGLRMGPDGWLYGRHGILGSSDVTIVDDPNDWSSNRVVPYPKPQLPLNALPETTRLHCGVWRYHPIHRTIEMVCEGTTNPWGMDWDAHGNLFFINTVIGHLWHAIPGAHLQRMYGEDSDPFAYELLPHIADHVHWDEKGEDWRATRAGPPSTGTDAAGGGHAHSGMMIYQADQWPIEYRNDLFTLNFHGRRINRERMERQGAGFVGKHDPDMVHWKDPWFRGIELSTGPDGSVYVLDWSDIGECHDDDGVHRTSGRIYRIVYDAPCHDRLNLLSKLAAVPSRSTANWVSEKECVALLRIPNSWYTQSLLKCLHLRRASLASPNELLDLALRPASRESNATRDADAVDPVVLQLRAIWALHAASQLTDDHLFRLLRTSQHESVHVWAIRLFAERYASIDESKRSEGEAEILDCLTAKPIAQTSSLVRLYTAALLPKFEHEQWRIAALLAKSKDLANDRDFPLVLWYGTKAMVADNPLRAAKLAVDCEIPKLTELYLRRFASGLEEGPEALSFLLADVARKDNRDLQRSAILGLWEAYQGRRAVQEPPQWRELAARASDHPEESVRQKVLLLKGVFQGEVAIDELIALANDAQASNASRRAAIDSLGRIDLPAARDALWKLVPDQFLGGAAAESLGQSLDIEQAKTLVAMYSGVWPPGKSGIVSALGNRRETLAVLLDAVEQQHIPVESIDAATWRQFTSVADWDLLSRARSLNPKLGVSEDKQKVIVALEQLLTEEEIEQASAARGRTHWNTLCAQCHKMFGEGGQIGPELTGGQRSNRRYWIENIVAPSEVVATNFRITAFLTDDGRVITGVPLHETSTEVTVQTVKDKLVLEKSEITQRRASELSLMPEGLLDPLDPKARADLMKYLMGPSQVPAK